MTPSSLAPVSVPEVESDEFSGPVDLLVDEVRRQNVAIERIALAPLTARFLGYVRNAERRNLVLDIEWLHMAAMLIQWKSRALLPHDPQIKPEERDPLRDELINLIRRHKREAAEALGERKQEEDTRLSPSRSRLLEHNEFTEEPDDSPFQSVFDLVGQARALAHWVSEYRLVARHWTATFDITPATVTVAQMSDLLRDQLRQASPLPANALPWILEQPTPARRACFFLGLLEMVRDYEITVSQVLSGERDGEETEEGIWIACIRKECDLEK